MAEAVSEVMIDGLETVLSHESELMGTAGGLALARARGLLGDSGSVLVVNGDCALGLDLQRLAARHMAGTDLVTLALLPHLDPQRWSRVVLDADGLVAAIHPPGPPDQIEVPLLYPGVMVIRRQALDALPLTPAEIPEILWNRARSEGRLGGVVVTGHWREVGTPADYLEVMLGRLAGTSVIDPTATVGGGTKIENSYVGREAVVSDRAAVADTIIAEGASVGAGATVERSILIGAVEISPDEHVTDRILAIEVDER
jgi:mannose-1-phosphate guanylyltransferase